MAEVTADRARTTVVVVPRERFSTAIDSLRSVLDHTRPPYELVYVDGKSPRGVRRVIEQLAGEHGFRVIRSDRYLFGNEARNLGAAEVDTEFVAFVENDVVVTPGWLDALVTCADQTGAAAVGPLTLERNPADPDTTGVIHVAGGDYALDGPPGRRRFSSTQRLFRVRLDELQTPLVRERVGFVEVHAVLLRTDALRPILPLDVELVSRDFLDLCMELEGRGGEVWFEPASVVTHLLPYPVKLGELRYYRSRWSDDRYRRAHERFVEKWGIDPEYLDRVSMAAEMRRRAYSPLRSLARRMVGDRTADRLGSTRDRLIRH